MLGLFEGGFPPALAVPVARQAGHVAHGVAYFGRFPDGIWQRQRQLLSQLKLHAHRQVHKPYIQPLCQTKLRRLPFG